jgi:hypothetical protein
VATPFSVLYESCLSKITDPTLLQLPEEDFENILHGWLISAAAKHRTCTHDLTDRDEELKQFNVNLTDLEIEILSILMAREWVSGQINSVTLTRQAFSGKETKYYSQAAHLDELITLDNKWKLEAQQLSRDYTYTDSTNFD